MTNLAHLTIQITLCTRSVSVESLFCCSCSSKVFKQIIILPSILNTIIVPTTQASRAASIVIELLYFGKWRNQQMHLFMHNLIICLLSRVNFCPSDIWGIQSCWNNSNVHWIPEPMKGALELVYFKNISLKIYRASCTVVHQWTGP